MQIGAFDGTALWAMRERGLPAYNISGALPEVHFRHAPYLFHRMGFLKAELIAQVPTLRIPVLYVSTWKLLFDPLKLSQRLLSDVSLAYPLCLLSYDRCCAQAATFSSPTPTSCG